MGVWRRGCTVEDGAVEEAGGEPAENDDDIDIVRADFGVEMAKE